MIVLYLCAQLAVLQSYQLFTNINKLQVRPESTIINKYAVRSRYSLWPIKLVKLVKYQRTSSLYTLYNLVVPQTQTEKIARIISPHYYHGLSMNIEKVLPISTLHLFCFHGLKKRRQARFKREFCFKHSTVKSISSVNLVNAVSQVGIW